MAKGGREKIKLESTAGTGHFYTTTKNKKTTPGKLEFLKYDPKARKHVAYKEVKLKEFNQHFLEKPAAAGFLFGGREAANASYSAPQAGNRSGWSPCRP